MPAERKTMPAALTGLGALAAVWLMSGAPAAQQSSAWSAPQNLGAGVNTAANEAQPALSPDGLSLYFTSNRPGGSGGEDIWATRRSSATSPWQEAVPLKALNSSSTESAPGFDTTGHWLFFGTEREGGCGGRDLWLSYRTDVKDDVGWRPPINMGCGNLSWPGFDDGPAYFLERRTGLGSLFFISDRPGGVGGRDIWMASHRNGRAFEAPIDVGELNSTADDQRPVLAVDGLEVIFLSFRPSPFSPTGATPDLWASRRPSTAQSWSAPVNLASLNSTATEGGPALSDDGRTLFFHSNRPDGFGNLDLYIATRAAAN